MSDLNDLLNYELGDDLDDQTLYGADEDELLLSDDDLEKDVTKEEKQQLKEEAEQWVKTHINEQQTNGTAGGSKSSEEVSSSANAKAHKEEDAKPAASDSDVSTSEESPVKQQLPAVCDFKQPMQATIITATTTSSEEVVTSTNLEDQSHTENAVVSSANSSHTESILPSSQDSSSLAGTEFSDPREDPEEEREERTNIKQASEREMEDGIDSSPDKHHNRFMHSKRGRGGIGGVSIMRGGMIYPGQRPLLRYPPHGGGVMGPGGTGGGFPQYPHHPNENINPQTLPGQFPPNPYVSEQKPLRHTYPPNQHPVPGPRMDFRQPGGSYRLPNPNVYGQVPHNEYSGGAVPTNGLPYVGSFPPNQHQRQLFRPELPSTMPGIRPPRMPLHRPPGIPLQGNPNYINSTAAPPQGIQRQQMPPQAQMPTAPVPPMATSQQSIRPSKVLINPNFKGGVEAATSKFIQETQFMHTISSHVSHLQSDEELLRQQEEFINKNRQHIEKRRNERSPPPRPRSRSRDRSRSRERSYSPPKRERHIERGNNGGGGGGGGGGSGLDRDRDRRAGSRDRYNSFNRGRFRRANSRDYENRNYGKRRRSASPMRRRDRDRNDMEEDEETRAYRLEIEKQKALREKILKDKEMRRRRAAEEKHHEDKPHSDEPPQKLKPIIVTESKIISLKRKQADNDASKRSDSHSHGNNNSSSSSSNNNNNRNSSKSIPTAKILPEAKRTLSDHISGGGGSGSTHTSTATAIIKPVVKKPPTSTSSQQIVAKPAKLHDTPSEDELDYEVELSLEDRLLADTPSPPLSPRPPSPKPSAVIKNSKAFNSSNRRVVLKPSASPSSSSGERRSEEGRGGGGGGGGRGRSRNKDSNDENYRKGIFDRLDRRIGVSEPGKRRIQRIVMKNASGD